MPKVTMPQLGESVAEGTIGKWLKSVGDHVDKYEPIVEVITDKVNAEVPSPFEGTLTEILVEEGATVPNNAEIAVVEATGETTDSGGPPAEPPAGSAAPGGAATADVPGAVAGAEATADESGEGAPSAEVAASAQATQTGPEQAQPTDPPRPVPTEPAAPGNGPAGSDERPDRASDASAPDAAAPTGGPPAPPDIAPELTPPSVGSAAQGSNGTNAAGAALAAYEGRMTPAVRRLAREHEVDLSRVSGTGHAGRITREDLLKYVEERRTAGSASSAPAAAMPSASAPARDSAAPSSQQVSAAPAAPAPGAPTAGAPTAAAAVPGATDELKPTTPMRKAIAAQMVRAATTAPHAYTTVEVDVSGLVRARDASKTQYQAREGVALSFVPFVTKAVVETLRRHPDLNGHWTDEGLVRKRAVNVGIAVAVEDGLVVPVVHNADQLSINGLNHAIHDLADRARANRLRLDDIQGGTFTVNNTGWFGSVASQQIVNVPQVAILSMEAIVKRPVVIESPAGDTIGIRPMMNVCVAFDHRATDGAQIGRFVQDVRRWLESIDEGTAIW